VIEYIKTEKGSELVVTLAEIWRQERLEIGMEIGEVLFGTCTPEITPVPAVHEKVPKSEYL